MKNILIAVVAVLAFNAIFVFSGGLDLLRETERETVAPATISPTTVDVFIYTLQDEVRKKVGEPKEGFEPNMFLDAFPGLVETDFDGVEASIGQYEITDGQLVHVPNPSQPLHSAAAAISREGMETLLENVSRRLEIDLTTTGTITDVMRALTNTAA